MSKNKPLLFPKLIEKILVKSYFLNHLINYILPKKSNRIFFISYPDFSDNPYALYKYIIKNYKDKFECIWEVSDEKNIFKINEKTIFARKNSLKYFYYLFTSKFVFSTHGVPGRCVKRQIVVPLYHGTPNKAWRYLDSEYDNNWKIRKIWAKQKKVAFRYISSSKIIKLAVSAGLNADPKNIIITGFPRCDFLFQNDEKILEKLFGEKIKDKKIILYLPTFRHWLKKSGLTLDSNFNVLTNLEELGRNKLFNDFLERNNYFFIYKLHPFEEELFNKKIKNPNFLHIRTENLQKLGITIYNILNKVDILVTDYSSIFIEFLLLNRPIFFLCPDFEEYLKRREFIYSPIEFWFPGPISRTNDEFVKEIVFYHEKFDKYKEKRRILCDIFHEYKDGESSARVFNSILKPFLNSKK